MSRSLTASLRETLALFDAPGEPRTTPEVAEGLDLGRRSTYERLQRLVEHGRLETKKVGANARVWWRPETAGRPGGDPDWPAAAESLVDDVLDDAEVGVFVLDEDFEVAWINEATERYFGLDRREVLGRDKRRLVEERISPVVEDSAGFAETVRATYDDNTYAERFECEVRPGGGREARWLEHRSKPIESGAYAGGRVELYYDVTAQKRSERAPDETERRFRSLVEAVDEYAIFVLDPEGHVRTWNEGARRIKGYARADIVGEHFSTFYTDEDCAAGVPERNLATAAADGVAQDEGWRVRADGSRFWAHVTITALYDDGGDLRGYAKVTRDTTERREYGQQLRHERDLIERVLETIPVGVGVFSSSGEIVRANERATEILGITEDETATYVAGERRIYDADGDPVPLEERPLTRVMETGESVLDWQCQIDHLDGERRWLSVNAAPLVDEDGEVERVVVAGEDVTRLKEQARRLERQRDDLQNELEDVFDRIDDGVCGLDRDLQFTYVNDRAEDLLDRSAGELVGEHVRDAFEPSPKVGAALEEAMETQQPVSFEEYYEPLGIWFENRVYPSETGLSVYFRDVTDRKQTEEALRRSEERYRTLFESIDQGFCVVRMLYDEDGEPEDYRFLETNSSFEEQTGLVDAEGKSMRELEPDHEDHWFETYGRIARTGEPERFTNEAKHLDDRWYDVYAFRIGRPEERKVAILFDDITDRKRFEETLQALYDASRELFHAESAADVDTVVQEAVTDVLDLESTAVYRYDDGTGELFPTASTAEEEHMREELPRIPPDDSSLTGHVYAAGEARLFEDVHESPYLQTDATEMRAGVFAPMGEHGIVVVGSREVGAFDERTARLVELLAATAEAAYDRVERERELEEYRRWTQTLVENFPAGAVALVDRDLRYVTFAGTPEGDTDLTWEDLQGRPVRDVLPEQIAEVVVPAYEAALDGESSAFEDTVDDRVYQFHFVPVRDDDGEVFAATAMSQDVTERKERERELHEAKVQLEAAAEAGGVGTWEWRIPEDRLVAGPSFARTFGVDPEVAREGQSLDLFLSRIHEDDLDRVERLVDEALESSGEYEAEYRVRNADDELRWVVARGQVECDGEGNPVTFPGVLIDITERKERERELERQRERLAALDDLNAVVRDITDAVIDQSTREEIERTVCERLADADTYEFAWIGEVDPRSGEIIHRAEAGVEGYLDAVDLSTDPDEPAGRGPGGRAVRTREVQVVRDAATDPDFGPWRDCTEEYGFRSTAAIPVVHGDTLYGLLGVYADRPEAFGGEEREVIAQLGEVVGHAIAAVERKRALMSDEVTELEFTVPDFVDSFGIDPDVDGTITFERAVPVGDGAFLQYGTVDADAVDLLEALVDRVGHFEDLTVVDRGATASRFELRLSEPPVLSAVAAHGGYVRRATIEDCDIHMRIHLPPTVEARRIIDAIQEAYPAAELLSRRQVARDETGVRVHRTVTEDLTDRQRAALEAAVYSGFFEWPRESSGEEVAESLDVAPPTFHQHLRKAQRKVFRSVFPTSAPA